MSSQLPLGLDDDLERSRAGGVHEDFVSIEDTLKLEAVSNQGLWVDLARPYCAEQRRSADRVDQARSDGDVAAPQLLQMEIHLRSMHPDIGDGSA